MPRAKKRQLCPVCGSEPVVEKYDLPTAKGEHYIAGCECSEHCGQHEIMTNAGDTPEHALNWWDYAVKKWAKRREKAIAEREVAEDKTSQKTAKNKTK
jgi:hypothetical protein